MKLHTREDLYKATYFTGCELQHVGVCINSDGTRDAEALALLCTIERGCQLLREQMRHIRHHEAGEATP